ncbi:hypothetical protein YA0032_25390 [Pseudomonas amygdali]|uniref:hypothetical protein n=1 Tax=Pseudomonas amygdali TaxID=47877 RepID=UPI0018E6195F|nr:hypothetical protein [Pseudomonas amygdali]MBI6731017.1 hypothetical protein [Pseudomonas amygdali]MBI6814445.1 hypothetical protein [Pseudomonas amygdali]
MQGKTEADVLQFVSEHFGNGTKTKLVNIGRGGDNNKKGADFENFYAAAKICMLAADAGAASNDFQVSCQEVAFVDDVCVRDLAKSIKINYQAKNSSGAPADWDEDMRVRFEMQQLIDLQLHGALQANQILLVSDAGKAAANDGKIPDPMRGYCQSEHFPHCSSSTKLVLAYQPLRQALSVLCGTNNAGTIDTAFRVVLGEWCADNTDGRVVGNVMARAKAVSKPDFFPGVPSESDIVLAGVREGEERQEISVPRWLAQILEAFHFSPAAVESGAFIIERNGMFARVGVNVDEPDLSSLQALQSPGDVFDFLMSLAAQQLVESLSTGDSHQ